MNSTDSAMTTIVIAGSREWKTVEDALQRIHTHYLPNAVLALSEPTDGSPANPILPIVKRKTIQAGAATIHVCKGATCFKPVTDINKIESLLLE